MNLKELLKKQSSCRWCNVTPIKTKYTKVYGEASIHVNTITLSKKLLAPTTIITAVKGSASLQCKDGLLRHGTSFVKMIRSYIYYGNLHVGKTTSLHWVGPSVIFTCLMLKLTFSGQWMNLVLIRENKTTVSITMLFCDLEPLLLTWIILIPAWLSDYNYYKVWWV